MAQDNTPAIVMYKGPQEDGYSIPFDKGYYGEVKVAFVRRGLTDYEYMPTTYTVDGALYAWEISTGVYYYTKSASPAVDATVYNSGNQEISGVKVVSTQNASASFSDGKMGIRSNKKDIHSHALLFWTGEPLGDDDWICIVRETVKKQPYSYPNNQKHIESALDNLSRQIQELKAQSDVSLKVDPTFAQDPQKMDPIDWLNTIVRSTDTTARGLRYRNFWLEYSTDDPNKAESDKSWTKLLNTANITSVREWYDEDNKVYIPQYSMDGGATWKSLLTFAGVYTKTEIDGKLTAVDAQIDANANAILKTREDYINADSEIHQILNSHANELTTLRGNQASLGVQVSNIEHKIPESASGSNPLITKQQLLDEEMDIRDDLNGGLSELQTQITAQAAEIATKQDQLVAGDNIVISGNTISATGAGGGVGFDMQVVDQLPATGEKGVIYLVPKDGSAPDVHDEYVWIDATQTFELIGTTQVDLTEYVKNTDYATASTYGVVKVDARGTYGVGMNDSAGLFVTSATETQIAAKTNSNRVISPKVLDYAVKVGVTTNKIELTDDEKTAAQAWLGIDSAGGGASLPDQTGNANRFLVTNGETTSWSLGVIEYKTGNDFKPASLFISDSSNSGSIANVNGSLRIGGNDIAQPGNKHYNTIIGIKAYAHDNAVAIGYNAAATSNYSIQLGTGTNNDANTFKVANANGNFEMMDASGNVPLERLTHVTAQIAESVTTKDLTVGTDEGTINIGVVAGTATIATNNGLDIVAQTKFDTAPTTDDNTTYANALDTSLVRKAQVATAIADAMANVDALPDQAGNAGKFLQTNGATASWAEVPAGGTKVIIKRYS